MLKSSRIAEDEELFPDLDPELLEKQAREREAAARALTLEMIGDLPFAEIKPPENVLFVCKLNPVTRDEDLELIFSRFGEIRRFVYHIHLLASFVCLCFLLINDISFAAVKLFVTKRQETHSAMRLSNLQKRSKLKKRISRWITCLLMTGVYMWTFLRVFPDFIRIS
jgi:RNA recognition motif-containing protein